MPRRLAPEAVSRRFKSRCGDRLRALGDPTSQAKDPIKHPHLAPFGQESQPVAAIKPSGSLLKNHAGRGGKDMSITMTCIAVLRAALLARS